MSVLNTTLTRTRKYSEAVALEATKREIAEKTAKEQAEYQRRANPRRRDDDEFAAMCGIGSPRFSAPPPRR